MKLKDAIVLGIGFSIGTIIFDTVILCIIIVCGICR